MPILDEIEAHFAKQPEWQQRGYMALRSGRVMDDALIRKLAACCIEEAAASDKAPAKKNIRSIETRCFGNVVCRATARG